jgi:diadenosine tetraphosphatase ApaH/serine/threonine PP2A family protein phosphatase
LIDGDVFAVHGGLSAELSLVQEVNAIERRHDIPTKGPFADILWSDPVESDGLTWRPNARGAGFSFGKAPIMEFNHIKRLRLIARSQQVESPGFRWYFGENGDESWDGPLLGVWSAPKYAHGLGNRASVLKFRFPGERECNLVTFGAAETRIRPDRCDRYINWGYT